MSTPERGASRWGHLSWKHRHCLSASLHSTSLSPSSSTGWGTLGSRSSTNASGYHCLAQSYISCSTSRSTCGKQNVRMPSDHSPVVVRIGRSHACTALKSGTFVKRIGTIAQKPTHLGAVLRRAVVLGSSEEILQTLRAREGCGL